MEERLLALESLLSTLVSAKGTEGDSSHGHRSTFGIAQNTGNNFACETHERDRDAVSMLSEVLSPKENSTQDDTVDGMGLVTFADEGTSGTFGESSS